MNIAIIDLALLIEVIMLLTKTFANKCNDAPYQLPGHVLLHHVIQSFHGTSSSLCFNKCKDNSFCHSINWYSKTGLCQLNNATHLSYPEGLVPDSNGRYSMVYRSQPMTSCSNKFCSRESICLTEKNGISYSCQSECLAPLGMQDKRILNSQITSSSVFGNYSSFVPYKGRLYSSGAWIGGNALGEYLQIDMKTAYILSKVATQGRRHDTHNNWVKKYRLEYSQDSSNWESYKYGGIVKHFEGNTDKETVVAHKIPSPIQARLIRFVVLEKQGLPAMRVEIYGCNVP